MDFQFLADENFDNRVLRGVRRAGINLDVIRVQDTEIYMADDPIVLEWAAKHGRILLTHDVNTINKYAYDRVRNGQPMLGVIAVKQEAPVGKVIEDFLVVLGASVPEEYENKVVHLPL